MGKEEFRDMVAIVLMAVLAGRNGIYTKETTDNMAEKAYMSADALLAQRGK